MRALMLCPLVARPLCAHSPQLLCSEAAVVLITTYSAGSGQAELGVLEPVNPSSNLQPLLVGSKTPKWPQSFGFSKTKMEVKSAGLIVL